MINVSKLKQKYEFSKINAVDKRKIPNVFELSPGIVGKVLLFFNQGDSELQKIRFKNFYKEYQIHKKAKEISKNNPQFNIGNVYGMVLAKNLDEEIYYPTIVMEDLGRKVISKLEDDVERAWAENLFFEQMEIAKKLGFIPRDCETYNGILKENKVYLIDFASWEYYEKK